MGAALIIYISGPVHAHVLRSRAVRVGRKSSYVCKFYAAATLLQSPDPYVCVSDRGPFRNLHCEQRFAYM